MAQSADEILVATGAQVWIGPAADVTPPTTETTAPGTGYVDVGYISEDGCTIRSGGSSDGVMVWQSATAVRTILQEREAQAAFALMQWSNDTLPIAFAGGVASDGHYAGPQGADPLPVVSIVADWTDKGFKYRLVIPRAQVAEVTETQLIRTEAADIPMTFDMLDPGSELFHIYSDDPAFAVV